MLQICSNIRQARLNDGKSQTQVADFLKINRSTYKNWEDNIEPDIDSIRKIADFLSVKWTDLVEGVIVATEKGGFQKGILKKKNEKEGAVLDFYSVGARAGKNEADILPVRKGEGKLHISDLFKGSQFAVRVSGNSMMTSYPPGSIIGIREVEDKRISPGSVYVVEKGNELWIKRLFYKGDDQDSGMFQLVSDNTMLFESGARKGELYYPAFYEEIDNVRIFKVTGIYKSNELTVIN